MTAGLGRGLALAGTGVVAGVAVVVALFGTGDLLNRVRGITAPGGTSRPLADLPPGTGPDTPAAKTDRLRPDGDRAAVDPGQAPLDKAPLAGPAPAPQAESRREGHAETAPSLDILRVEPSGETVLAGRGAPKAAVELLRDNRPIARVTADEAGQFAMDGLALPPGNSELTLRTTAPDGTTAQGRVSAVVVVDKDRKTQPLVAVSEPDKPTRVLSQPETPPQAKVAQAAKPAEAAEGSQPGKAARSGRSGDGSAGKDAGRPAGAGEKAGAAAPVKIVSVDAQDGGRLFVAGQAAAWTSLRLYLNDTLVASGRSGADGRIAFTIGRGVRPGGYQIRIDQVEPESGKVGNRAQVGFTFPQQLAAKEPGKDAGKATADAAARPADKPVADLGPRAPTPRAVTGEDATSASRTGETPRASASTAGAPAAVPPPATRPTVSETPSMAAGSAPGKPSLESDRRTEAGMPILPRDPRSPGADAGAGQGLPATPPGSPPRLAETPSASPGRPDVAVSAAPPPGDEAGTVFVPEISTATIIRGDSLWQISRKTYGDGKRYTVIYDANQGQIRDPDLIYPGQIFVLPKDLLPKDSLSKDSPAAKRG